MKSNEPHGSYERHTGETGSYPTMATPLRKTHRGVGMILASNRKPLLLSGLVGALLFLVLAFLWPETYTASTSVLPPERQASGGMLSMLAGASSALDLLKGGDNPTLDLFKTIVESRNIAEEVSKDPKIFAYLKRFDTSRDAIAGSLQRNIQSEAFRTGMFTVTVDLQTHWMPSQAERDSARQLAAHVANTYVAELDRFNRERLMTTARNTRVFIEREYNQRMQQLDTAYQTLQRFQETHKAISLPEQLAATVASASKLSGEIQQLEMQQSFEQRELNPSSSKLQLLQAQLDAARAQLQKYDDGGAGEYILALKNVPELGRELARDMREVKVLEQVSGYLRQQLEQERISEQRDLPSLQILDSARAPLKRTSPHRSVMAFVGAILGLLLGFGYVGVRSLWEGAQARPEDHYRFLNVLRAIRRGKSAQLIAPAAKPAEPKSSDVARVHETV